MARGSNGVPVPQLAALRKRLGLSQGELAERAGLTRTTITRLEQGGVARYQTIDKLASALNSTRQRLIRVPRQRPGTVTRPADGEEEELPPR
ncbi:MAG TPA: helix-turn-helix transcriptional regulator [Ktedonobacterales bacterium]|jgi:transcriptional regulator with XRE-family HTH domain